LELPLWRFFSLKSVRNGASNVRVQIITDKNVDMEAHENVAFKIDGNVKLGK
jgi:hypothetical protein